ncbi:MAG: PAS domain-containing protein, partial [Bacteroidia bacterium]
MANNLSHRLLKRQIRKFLPPNLKDGNELDDFINAINQAYIEFDEDLKRTEHILEESSKELFKANKGLQKIAEEKTKEAEQTAKRLQTVADSISEVIFQMNMDGTWSYLNSAWESITHYSVSESLGTTIFDYVHPLDVEGIQEAFLPISKGEKESCSKTIRFFTKDKEIRWINIKAKLTYNDKKELAGLSGSISDITANYLTQKENEQLALIVQKTKNIMVLTDSNGRITWVNNAFENLTEFALEEIKGKRPGDFLQGENTDLRTIKRIGEH